MTNIVYALTNPSISDVVKIGMTSNLENRLRSLYNSSVPVPFECYFACEVDSMEFVDFRVNPKREFFRIDPERIVSILRLVMIKDVTPSSDIVEDEVDQRSLDKERIIRSRFNFEMIDIPMGSTLTFTKDITKTAKVLDKQKIEFEGEVHSLSSSALEIVHSMGCTWSQISGPSYWVYEGETLTERRLRMEQG